MLKTKLPYIFLYICYNFLIKKWTYHEWILIHLRFRLECPLDFHQFSVLKSIHFFAGHTETILLREKSFIMRGNKPESQTVSLMNLEL